MQSSAPFSGTGGASSWPWVQINPRDRSCPSFVKIDPAVFSPKRCEHYLCCVNWGVPDEEESRFGYEEDDPRRNYPSAAMRTMETQSMYMFKDSPEVY